MSQIFLNVFAFPVTAVAAVIGIKYAISKLDLFLLLIGHAQVRSNIDGKLYYVLQSNHKAASADLLAQTRKSMWTVIEHVRLLANGTLSRNMTRGEWNGVKRLANMYKSPDELNLYELDWVTDTNIAFNRNKTGGIFICLLANTETETLASPDTILFIALHELAHAMHEGYDPLVNGRTHHSKGFKVCELLLYRIASDINVLNYTRIPGTEHCRGRLVDPFK